ncbi:MAG TPA: phage tail protein, partial [Kofleriaceae bacterium]|nr:phage tail protein [Kofleriaceae bacterium]
TAQKKSYTSGHFELEIDGHKSTAYLKSVEGGHVIANPVDEPVSTHNQRIKSISTLDVEPMTLDLGLSGARDILKWMGASLRKKYTRRNGVITHANFNLEATYRHEFYNALITEMTFPALDGSSKDSAYLKVKIQPEWVQETKINSTAKITPTGGLKQKLWSANSFRLNIDGRRGFELTNKIEAFTIKQGVKKVLIGEQRMPELEPTKLEFPHLVGTIALEHADSLFAWRDQYHRTGSVEKANQTSGSLEFLGPNKKDILFQINLFEVGVHKVQLQQSQANQDSIKRVKFELFVGRMEMDKVTAGLD